jgi:hypothetical protein
MSEITLFPDLDKIKQYLIDENIYDSIYNFYPEKCLILAAENNRSDVLEYLMYNGCGSNKIYIEAFEAAIKKHHIDVVNYISSFLGEYCENKKMDIIKLCLESDFLPMAVDLVEDIFEFQIDEGLDLLEHAAYCGRKGFLEYLMTKFAFDDNQLILALFQALHGNQLQCFKYLFKCGAKIGKQDLQEFQTINSNFLPSLEMEQYLSTVYGFVVRDFYVDKMCFAVIEIDDINTFVSIMNDISIPLAQLWERAAICGAIKILEYLSKIDFIIDGDVLNEIGWRYQILEDCISCCENPRIYDLVMAKLEPDESVLRIIAGRPYHANVHAAKILFPYLNLNDWEKGCLFSNLLIEGNIETASYLVDNYGIDLKHGEILDLIQHAHNYSSKWLEYISTFVATNTVTSLPYNKIMFNAITCSNVDLVRYFISKSNHLNLNDCCSIIKKFLKSGKKCSTDMRKFIIKVVLANK